MTAESLWVPADALPAPRDKRTVGCVARIYQGKRVKVQLSVAAVRFLEQHGGADRVLAYFSPDLQRIAFRSHPQGWAIWKREFIAPSLRRGLPPISPLRLTLEQEGDALTAELPQIQTAGNGNVTAQAAPPPSSFREQAAELRTQYETDEDDDDESDDDDKTDDDWEDDE